MDDLWIIVENERVLGDIGLGISQGRVKGFWVTWGFPQLSPQLLIGESKKKASLMWSFLCNYNQVISVTHLSTAVITTNFKYKTFSRGVRLDVQGAAI